MEPFGVEQVLNQHQQLLDLAVNALHAFSVPVAEGTLAQENTAVAVDEGQRSAQLVGGNRHELALHVLEQLELSRHLVEGAGERPDLIPLPIVDAHRKIAARDLLDTSPQRNHAGPKSRAQRQSQEQRQHDGTAPRPRRLTLREAIDGVCLAAASCRSEPPRGLGDRSDRGGPRRRVAETVSVAGLQIARCRRRRLEDPRRRASQVRELMAHQFRLLRGEPSLSGFQGALGARQAVARRFGEARIVRKEGVVLESRQRSIDRGQRATAGIARLQLAMILVRGSLEVQYPQQQPDARKRGYQGKRRERRQELGREGESHPARHATSDGDSRHLSGPSRW